MKLSYDDDADVLYVVFIGGSCVDAAYMERDSGDVIRYNTKTLEVLGVTIPSFIERAEAGEEINIPELGAVQFTAMMEKLLESRKKRVQRATR